MRMLMAALAAALILAAAAPASARFACHHRRHASADLPRYQRWPVGWQNVPIENRGGACPEGDCGRLGTRRN